jgi:hypothetical protein
MSTGLKVEIATHSVLSAFYVLRRRRKQQLNKHEMNAKKHFYSSSELCSGEFEH